MMEPTTPKEKEQLSPEREKLEIKLKEIEIDQKTQDLEIAKRMDSLEIERRKLENDQLKDGTGGWSPAIQQLLQVVQCWAIDNEKTIIGSEPALKSVWEEHEMDELKRLIMKKARQL